MTDSSEVTTPTTFLSRHSGTTGKWQKGQSGNPKGRPSQKPFKEALSALAGKSPEALAQAAAALMARAMTGDVAALKEVADRLDGKVPASVGGSTELGPVKLQVAWKKS